MHSRLKWSACLLGLAALFVAVGAPARAQDKQHVVSLSDLSKDAARPAQTRQANEEAVRTLLSSDQGQKALKSTGADYTKVNQAVGQLSDEDAARMAAQSRAIQKDIAAGNFSDRDLLIVIVCIAALVLIIVAVR